MSQQADSTLTNVSPDQIKDTFRRFGHYGPVYHIMGVSRESKEGEILMKIHIFETNEELEYPFSAILNDPKEY